MAIYYVKTAGNDSLNGLSDANAWATLAKVGAATFVAGDSVLLNKGGTWRGVLTVHNSGSSGSYITYGAYGTGNAPRILGSKVSTGWANTATNIWKSNTTFTNPDLLNEYTARPGTGTDLGGCGIYFENTGGTKTWGTYKNSTAAFTAEYDWTWSANYIYVYAASSPTTRYTAVEVPQRGHIINLSLKQYITISGINLFYSGRDCVSYDVNGSTMRVLTGLIIENCEIGYVSTKGSGAGYGVEAIYSTMIVRGCDIHDCGRRALSFHLYGTPTVSNVLIENNYFHDGFHTTGPDFSIGNYGGGTYTNFTIRRNRFYDPVGVATFYPYGSNLMFMQRENSAASIGNFYIYSNIFINPQQAAIQLEYTNNPIYVYNNTFYGHNSTVTGNTAHVWVDGTNGGNTSVKVKNNAFYSSLSYETGGAGCELFAAQAQVNTAIDADYNLYYRTSNSLRIVEWESHYVYHMNEIASIRTNLGWETHSPTPANPNFVTPGTDFHLQAGSPAINAGVYLVDVAVDFTGTARTNPPSIGAYDYIAAAPVVPTVTTTSITNISTTTATGGGNVTSDGGASVTVRGVCWSTSANPTTANSKTTDATGTGVFVSSLSGLTLNTLYHVRAYATNSVGTSYGSDVTFTTAASILVNSITLSAAGAATTITTYHGTLQVSASVLPVNATNPAYTWSITNGSGTASISAGGLVSALTNGTVTVVATANDGSGVTGTYGLTLSNQVAPPVLVNSITVTAANGDIGIATFHGTLQMSASVLPVNATNQTYTWSITNQTGSATISAGGLVTAVSDGNVLVVATANDSGAVQGTHSLILSNQTPIILVSSITITSAGGATTINTKGGTLQMSAAVLPANANDKTYTWSVVYGTGQATITNGGLVTAQANGTVTVKATANDSSGYVGSFVVTILNQADIPLQRYIRKSTYRGYTPTDIKVRTTVPEAASIARNATTVDFANITVTKIANAIGSSSHLISVLCRSNLVNKWAGFSPYLRSVVGGVLAHNKPTMCKAGDFAGYNHNAATPHYESTTHASDVWIIPGEIVHFAPTVNIGELKYIGGDIIGHSDCVGIALTVWDGTTLVASQVINLATAKDVIYPDATITGGSSDKTYTVKLYLVNSLSSFDYTLSGVVCQVTELANYTKAVRLKQGTAGVLSSPPGWAISGTPISLNLTTGSIAFQGLHNTTYSGHLTVTAYISDWLGNKITDDTVLWTGTYSGNYGIVIGNVVIWKLGGITKALPIPGYGYTATVYVNPT